MKTARSLNLSQGQLSLGSILAAAQQRVEQFRFRPAGELPQAFIREVAALQRSGQLDAGTAQQLLAAAEAVLQQ